MSVGMFNKKGTKAAIQRTHGNDISSVESNPHHKNIVLPRSSWNCIKTKQVYDQINLNGKLVKEETCNVWIIFLNLRIKTALKDLGFLMQAKAEQMKRAKQNWDYWLTKGAGIWSVYIKIILPKWNLKKTTDAFWQTLSRPSSTQKQQQQKRNLSNKNRIFK